MSAMASLPSRDKMRSCPPAREPYRTTLPALVPIQECPEGSDERDVRTRCRFDDRLTWPHLPLCERHRLTASRGRTMCRRRLVDKAPGTHRGSDRPLSLGNLGL